MASRREELIRKFGSNFVSKMMKVEEDIRFASPWHGWSVYDREREDGSGWGPAPELCTEVIAQEMKSRAKRVSGLIKTFLNQILSQD